MYVIALWLYRKTLWTFDIMIIISFTLGGPVLFALVFYSLVTISFPFLFSFYSEAVKPEKEWFESRNKRDWGFPEFLKPRWQYHSLPSFLSASPHSRQYFFSWPLRTKKTVSPSLPPHISAVACLSEWSSLETLYNPHFERATYSRDE